MKKLARFLILAAASAVMLTGCTTSDDAQPQLAENSDPLKIVTSFTILADIVNEIAGDAATVHNLVPTGTDPHEYEPLPADLRAAAGADLLFFNGLNLEGGDAGWFARLVSSADQQEAKVVEVSKRITPMYIGGAAGHETQVNPHAFTTPGNGFLMAEEILAALKKADPQNAEVYESRAAIFFETLRDLEADYKKRIGAIAPKKRTLVTSERAFQYLAKEYDLREAFLWEIDTEENGSIQQIKELLAFLDTAEVSHLIVESNVDPRPMQTVSDETGIPIFGEVIYSDEIGGPGAETYVEYLRHNLDVIAGALA